MATITTNLTYLTSKGDNLTYILDTHTNGAVRYCNQLRQIPGDNSKVARSEIQLAYGVLDADGLLLPQKLVCGVYLYTPVAMANMSTTQGSILGTMADVAFSDEGQAALQGVKPIVSL